jgi:hypothetical protein
MMFLDVDTCSVLFADGVLYKREKLRLGVFGRGSYLGLGRCLSLISPTVRTLNRSRAIQHGGSYHRQLKLFDLL